MNQGWKNFAVWFRQNGFATGGKLNLFVCPNVYDHLGEDMEIISEILFSPFFTSSTSRQLRSRSPRWRECAFALARHHFRQDLEGSVWYYKKLPTQGHVDMGMTLTWKTETGRNLNSLENNRVFGLLECCWDALQEETFSMPLSLTHFQVDCQLS